LAAELHALKWERMFNPRVDPWRSPIQPLSRYIGALPEAEPGPPGRTRVRLLFVVSALSDLEAQGLAPDRCGDEVRRLLRALQDDLARAGVCQATFNARSTGCRASLQADLERPAAQPWPTMPQLDNIVQHLAGQHVLHFLGHGEYRDGQGRLALEGMMGPSSG